MIINEWIHPQSLFHQKKTLSCGRGISSTPINLKGLAASIAGVMGGCPQGLRPFNREGGDNLW